ncbi:MAG TPA: carboxy terminal-processing peptidase [Chitinophagaceae bacterium]|nr:carboxy terminal-processing peptidase [Chitinophagaceae bacterium]
MRKVFVIILFSALIFCFRLSAQFSSQQQKAFLVKRMIELNHYSPRAVDDSFSVSLFKTMINTVDPKRLLFTASEYKSLSDYHLKLDDELTGKGWVFLDLFTSLYKEAVSRADSIIGIIINKPPDFTFNETIITSSQKTYNFAANFNELANRWTRYLKLMILENIYAMNEDDSTGKALSKEEFMKLEPESRTKVGSAEKRKLKKASDNTADINAFLLEVYLNSVATCFDPHTNYFSQEGKEMLQSALSSEGLSFGLEFDENENGKIIINHLAPGGPAWKSGELNKGDELLQLNWEGKEPEDIPGMSVEDIYEMLEQPEKDRLVVKVKKANGAIKTVALRKEKISNEENIVRSCVLKGEKKIGYILLPGFYTDWDTETGSGCANDVAKEVIKLKRENIDGLLIDIRFNGGGSVYEGLELTGIFIDEGPLGVQKDAKGKVTNYRDPNRGVIYEGPLSILVNSQSASASEMLAASLQDYNRAVIVGSNTFGKATVQQLFPLDSTHRSNGDLPANATEIMKITFGKFYRLDGGSAQLKGVIPDVVLPDAFDGLNIGEKFFTNALISDTVKKNNYYKPLSLLPVSELAKRSAERVNNNPGFQNIKKVVAALSKTGKQEIIPLKWEEFARWRGQHELNLKASLGETLKGADKLLAENNQYDRQWIQNDNDEKEINKIWLDNIAEDIYIREAFLVLCDLINLQKASSKN